VLGVLLNFYVTPSLCPAALLKGLLTVPAVCIWPRHDWKFRRRLDALRVCSPSGDPRSCCGHGPVVQRDRSPRL